MPCHILLILIRALVVSKADYCNLVLTGISGHLMNRIQSILNAAAWLVFSVRWSDHITQLLHELYWLRVPEWIQFQLYTGVLLPPCHGAALSRSEPPFDHERHHLQPSVVCRQLVISYATTSTIVSLAIMLFLWLHPWHGINFLVQYKLLCIIYYYLFL